LLSIDLVPYLNSITGASWLFGQEVPEDSRVPTPDQLLSALPFPPAILGVNVLVGDADNVSRDVHVQSLAAAHTTAGGIVFMTVHPPNFFDGIQDIGTAWAADTNAPKPDLSALLSPSGGVPHARYTRMVSRIIAWVKTLPTSAVVVLRPWHEANGPWFWWGLDVTNLVRSEAGVRALWLNTMSQVQAACPNVLGGFSWGMAWYAGIGYGYPGSAVDVVGASLYSDKMIFANKFGNDYAILTGFGKPAVLFEVGSLNGNLGWDARIIGAALATRYPLLCAANAWQDGFSWMEMANSSVVLNGSRVVGRAAFCASMPAGYVWAASDPGVRLVSARSVSAGVRIPVWTS